MLHTRMPGQCGAHVLHYAWDMPFSIPKIAASFGAENFDGAVVMFSGNDRADGPGLFAQWLRDQREEVVMSKWIPNPRHNSQIRFYRWIPTKKFRDLVQTDIVKLRTKAA